MQVILCEDVTGLGAIGDLVRVKRGYARNYLLPHGLAVVADSRNLKQLEHEKRVIAAKRARDRGAVERVAEAMGGLLLETESRAGRGGKLFGSVTNMDVARLLAAKDFEVDRRRIDLKDPIKAIGSYEVAVHIGQDIKATVTVVVKPIGGELEDTSVDGDEPVEDLPPPVSTDDETEDQQAEADADEPEAEAAGEEAQGDDQAKDE